MSLFAVGLNHTTAPVELREQLAVPEPDLRPSLDELAGRAELSEVMLLSTCNRVEIYGVAEAEAVIQDPAHVIETLASIRGLAPRKVRQHAFARDNEERAARHIFRVAASLESMVVGEPQILGQVKSAYAIAREAGTVGTVLDRCLTMAFHGAKRVRSQTEVAQGRASVASVAVDLARSIFGHLRGKRCMLLGAGEMAEHAAIHLQAAGVEKVIVVNRSPERGEALAERIRGVFQPLSQLEAVLPTADIIICSTGAREPVILPKTVRRSIRARRGTPQFFVDIAVPRDVDPRVSRIDQAFVYNVDDLQSILRDSINARVAEAEHAGALVEEEISAFLRWKRARDVTPMIVALTERGESIIANEMLRAGTRLDGLTEAQREAVEHVARGIVKKMLHGPLTALRLAGEQGQGIELAESVRRLFDLPWPDGDEDQVVPDLMARMLRAVPDPESDPEGDADDESA